MYEERFYRKRMNLKNLIYFRVCDMETDLYIGAQRDLSVEALFHVQRLRKDIINYIKKDIFFKDSFVPIAADIDAPQIIKGMCRATKMVNVGPMAAVAGAVSELVAFKLLDFSDEIVVENGGDIFLKTNVVRKIGIYAGPDSVFNNLGINIKPEDTPMGICTSSGILGHSFSYGKADAVIVLAKSTFLADAAATAIGNMIQNVGDIQKGIDFAVSISELSGVIIIVDGKIGIWGNVELTEFNADST